MAATRATPKVGGDILKEVERVVLEKERENQRRLASSLRYEALVTSRSASSKSLSRPAFRHPSPTQTGKPHPIPSLLPPGNSAQASRHYVLKPPYWDSEQRPASSRILPGSSGGVDPLIYTRSDPSTGTLEVSTGVYAWEKNLTPDSDGNYSRGALATLQGPEVNVFPFLPKPVVVRVDALVRGQEYSLAQDSAPAPGLPWAWAALYLYVSAILRGRNGSSKVVTTPVPVPAASYSTWHGLQSNPAVFTDVSVPITLSVPHGPNDERMILLITAALSATRTPDFDGTIRGDFSYGCPTPSMGRISIPSITIDEFAS